MTPPGRRIPLLDLRIPSLGVRTGRALSTKGKGGTLSPLPSPPSAFPFFSPSPSLPPPLLHSSAACGRAGGPRSLLPAVSPRGPASQLAWRICERRRPSAGAVEHTDRWKMGSVQPGVLHGSQPVSDSGHGVRQIEQRGSRSHVQTYSPHSQRALRARARRAPAGSSRGCTAGNARTARACAGSTRPRGRSDT